MLLNLQKQIKKPLYIQIYQLIKEKIHTRELTINEKLPSKRQLAITNDVSENTIMNAYNQLLTEGYIYAIERKGYYVSDVDLHFELPVIYEKKASEVNETEKFLYDFTRSNPDEEIFPFSVFSKLYRNLFNRSTVDNLLSETTGQGLLELRESLQRYLSLSRGIPCNADQIILGPSTEYLLSILFQLFPQPPAVGVEDPGYHGFKELFQRKEISTHHIPITENGADTTYLQASPVNIMIATSNHQFPTGSIMPLSSRQKLLNWASEKDNRFVIENDYDSEFKYSGIPIPSLKQLDKNNRVIHLGSFTRVLAPGVRLSYMVLPQNLIKTYIKLFAEQSAPLSTFEQWLIHDFIEDGHFTTHLNRSRTFYKKKRDLMIEAIKKQDKKAKIIGEKAGLHLLVQPSITFDGHQFKKFAAENKMKINLLSDFSENIDEDTDSTLFLSFSNLPTNKINKIIKKLYKIIHLSKNNDMIDSAEN